MSDNFPYFLNIAYQDSNNVWQGDLRQRYFDTVARTVSLDISHFTKFGVQDGISVEADPRTIIAGQTSIVTMNESLVLKSDGSNYVTAQSPIPQQYVEPWMVNGIAGGNSSIGTIAGTGDHVVYTAPADLSQTITVFVSAALKSDEIFVVKGKQVHVQNPVRGVNITVLPFAEYDYLIKIDYIDSSISTMYSSISDPDTAIPRQGFVSG